MKVKLISKWACPVCGDLYRSFYIAEDHCPRDRPDERLVCSVCNEDFDTDKSGQREAANHLKTHQAFDPDEVYIERLLFNAQPPLGQWAVTMEAQTEFLLPNG